MSQTISEPTERAVQDQSNGPRMSDDQALEALRTMQLIREFESRTMQAYQRAKIGGFCHIYTGQEACAVGTIMSLEKTDPVVTAYRDHGHALARGMHPSACMAEMFGKLAGCAKGKGGSMHMFDRPNHLYGGHGIVGAQTPLGLGLAFACRYQLDVMGSGEKRVALCYLGDGALGQGAFYEALNLATLFSTPVIYVLENNGYSMGTALKRHAANADRLVDRAEAFGVRGVEMDGLDVMSLYEQFRPVVDDCRERQVPAFVDLKTYRYQGHSMSDPQKYRTKDEVEQYKEKDSIARLASQLMTPKDDGGRGILSEDDWSAMQKEIKDLVKEAMDFAEEAEAPGESELTTDVYANPQPNLSPQSVYGHGVKNPLL
ncbi:MAG: pyruvate dehydrogenase (acetyl-transferring) E1 component subunit alpha [Phycisphaerae bacterium]|nr:pyruvate dehydrogenase (acetyl-transferring) E1 component subunit alpha [Phycisphaerae bacterium]